MWKTSVSVNTFAVHCISYFGHQYCSYISAGIFLEISVLISLQLNLLNCGAQVCKHEFKKKSKSREAIQEVIQNKSVCGSSEDIGELQLSIKKRTWSNKIYTKKFVAHNLFNLFFYKLSHWLAQCCLSSTNMCLNVLAVVQRK